GGHRGQDPGTRTRRRRTAHWAGHAHRGAGRRTAGEGQPDQPGGHHRGQRGGHGGQSAGHHPGPGAASQPRDGGPDRGGHVHHAAGRATRGHRDGGRSVRQDGPAVHGRSPDRTAGGRGLTPDTTKRPYPDG